MKLNDLDFIKRNVAIEIAGKYELWDVKNEKPVYPENIVDYQIIRDLEKEILKETKNMNDDGIIDWNTRYFNFDINPTNEAQVYARKRFVDCCEVIVENMLANGYWKRRYWYAVQKDENDNDWGTGCNTFGEAIKYANENGYNIIAKIELGEDPVCVDIYKKEAKTIWCKQ